VLDAGQVRGLAEQVAAAGTDHTRPAVEVVDGSRVAGGEGADDEDIHHAGADGLGEHLGQGAHDGRALHFGRVQVHGGQHHEDGGDTERHPVTDGEVDVADLEPAAAVFLRVRTQTIHVHREVFLARVERVELAGDPVL